MASQTEGGHDKFYVLQLLVDTVSAGAHYVWQRWGRTGTNGQSTLKGPLTLAAARAEFAAKYKDKTKNVFGAPGGFVRHPGKYALAAGPAASGPAAKAAKSAAGKATAPKAVPKGPKASAKAAPTGPKAAPKAPKAGPSNAASAAAAPAAMTNESTEPVVVAWRRYLTAYAEHGGGQPTVGGSDDGSPRIGKPATDADIAKLEKAFGQPITAELRALLKVSDGADLGLGGYHHLYSCKSMIDVLAAMRKLWNDEWKDNPRINGSVPDEDGEYEGVKFAWWRMGWLPIGGDDTGNLFVMDYDPDTSTGGEVGQVLDHDHETGDCPCMASTLAEYLNEHAEEIETGKQKWDDDFGAYTLPYGGGGGDDDDDDDDQDDGDDDEVDEPVVSFTVHERGRGAPIDMNMTRAEVFAALGKPDNQATRPSKKEHMERFSAVHVSFDKSGHVDWVGVMGPNKFLLHGRDLLAMPFYAACDVLRELDPNLQTCEDDSYPTSFALNVCIWSESASDNPFAPAEQIAYFRDGYYDDLVKSGTSTYRPFVDVETAVLELAAWAHEMPARNAPVDVAAARALYQRAAARGSALGRARCAEHGWGTPVDPATAVQLYTQAAADEGSDETAAIAQQFLASCIERGFGASKNASKARQLRKKAQEVFDDLVESSQHWRE